MALYAILFYVSRHCFVNRLHYKALIPVFEQLSRNGTKEIIEAYDMDKYTNPNVERCCLQMLDIASDMGFIVRRLKWNKEYKGIDDWLANKPIT